MCAQLPYKVVEVNPLTKSELKWSTYKKVPVMKLDEEVVVDSSAIISRLASEVEASSSSSSSATAGKGWVIIGQAGKRQADYMAGEVRKVQTNVGDEGERRVVLDSCSSGQLVG
jgi:glutathione S-transferase